MELMIVLLVLFILVMAAVISYIVYYKILFMHEYVKNDLTKTRQKNIITYDNIANEILNKYDIKVIRLFEVAIDIIFEDVIKTAILNNESSKTFVINDGIRLIKNFINSNDASEYISKEFTSASEEEIKTIYKIILNKYLKELRMRSDFDIMIDDELVVVEFAYVIN